MTFRTTSLIATVRSTPCPTSCAACAEGASTHPRLEVLLLFKTPNGRKEFRVKDAVADSGAQITIIPASMLSDEGISVTGLRRSSIDLRAANNVKMNMLGVVDADISALSPSGERFSTATSAYVVKNVDKVFLSLEVMVGLRIVDKQFPTAGAGNQHKGTYCASAAASSPACKCLPRSPPLSEIIYYFFI